MIENVVFRPCTWRGDPLGRQRSLLPSPETGERSIWENWSPGSTLALCVFLATDELCEVLADDRFSLLDLTPEEESVRDLCRAREDAKEDQQRCRHRLSGRGRILFDGRSNIIRF